MAGGAIALVKDGDQISIDVEGRSLSLDVDEEELAARKSAWIKPEPKLKGGILGIYARLAEQAETGAVIGN